MNVGNPRVRSPSVAEIVAGRLRERIVLGDLADGDLLPKQEHLIEEFGVSRPSVREALRILEAEGLVSVRRGKVGGAVVHRPRVDNAAAVIEVVLRSQNVSVEDISEAIRRIEPICAALCAARPDRAEEVLPRLQAVHDEAGEHLDDVRMYTRLARRFHEELVATCGNQTMILVVGTLEAVLSAHAAVWADERTDNDGSPVVDAAFRRQGQDDHALLLRLIERGDVEAASREARQHLERAPVYKTDKPVPLKGGQVRRRHLDATG
jgi:GntR family transcriptional regulator, transcriptional repressor for pyruvate dehydrogenase complex